MTPSHAFRHHPVIRNVVARPRLLISIIIGLLALLAMPQDWRLPTRLLIAWNLGTWTYLASAFLMIARSTTGNIRRQAVMGDEGRWVVLAAALMATTAAFGGIFAELVVVKEMQGWEKAAHLCLAGATVLSAWTFTHVMFAQHYAHEYFIERASEKSLPEEYRGGLNFPGVGPVDYFDFVYFSFIIGVASQTADIEICSPPMRRVSLVHSLVSFFFNTTILALMINIASGLV